MRTLGFHILILWPAWLALVIVWLER